MELLGVRVSRSDVVWLVLVLGGLALVAGWRWFHSPVALASWDLTDTDFTWSCGGGFNTSTFLDGSVDCSSFQVVSATDGADWTAQYLSDGTKTCKSRRGHFTNGDFRQFLKGLTEHGVWTLNETEVYPANVDSGWFKVALRSGDRHLEITTHDLPNDGLRAFAAYMRTTECGRQWAVLDKVWR